MAQAPIPPHRSALSRRAWLRLAGMGVTVGGLPAVGRAGDGPGFGKAKSVLFVFTSGGMSQLETFDPKPDAPEEVRGEFRTIPTAVPGTRFGEHLPRLARLADRYAILRSLSHDDLDHGSAVYLTLTGHFHSKKSANPPPRPTDHPSLGALLHRARPAKGFPHTAVTVNGPVLAPEEPAPGLGGGYLGRAYDPLLVGDPVAEDEALPGLEGRTDLPAVRLETRRNLLQRLDGPPRPDPVRLEADAAYRQAYALLDAPRVRTAFELGREPLAIRERYGLHRAGQACLLGRRLVEAGVPLVTVCWNHCIRGQDRHPDATDWYGWDTHNDLFESMRDHLLPRFDQTFAALLEDMEQRGLLKTTLVICAGEFGRAPRVALEKTFAGTTPGRKHWAAVYSALVAGAGVTGGAVIGASDRHAAYPKTTPHGPWDLAATMFAALGVHPATTYTDPTGRPLPLTDGRAIRAIYE